MSSRVSDETVQDHLHRLWDFDSHQYSRERFSPWSLWEECMLWGWKILQTTAQEVTPPVAARHFWEQRSEIELTAETPKKGPQDFRIWHRDSRKTEKGRYHKGLTSWKGSLPALSCSDMQRSASNQATSHVWCILKGNPRYSQSEWVPLHWPSLDANDIRHPFAL